MKIYEKRIYSIATGQMPEVANLYENYGWPAMKKGGYDKYLVGYFISDTGILHQLIHIWKFESDEERRLFWESLYSNQEFMSFAKEVRQHIKSQDVQLMKSASLGAKPMKLRRITNRSNHAFGAGAAFACLCAFRYASATQSTTRLPLGGVLGI